ncbi:hypothetical protein [Burkholderia ubonensis]|uniref:hypothetical protein n=1 Tax=Burkholderia ubonensis TaxID=101571 RepID=UPI000A8707AF|nr:hypothetical protein [Burkholderia ubonensis]
MSRADAKNRAVDLVKEAIAAGVLGPTQPGEWLLEPDATGEKLGKVIAAAVKAATDELEKL